MAEAFRILYVDDEPDLLELGRIYLEMGKEFRVDTAESGGTALGLLGTETYEAIVSDYQMPEMDGIALLKEVRSQFGTIPFILFTGRGREEIVVQALNNGADFYLQKGGDPKAQFAELSHKIQQAVSRRRAEQALLESEIRFRDLTENSLDTIMLFDRDLRHVYVNPNVESQTGIPAAQFIGKTHAELGFPPDLTSLWERTLREAFESGKNQRIEFRIPSGIWIDWLVVPIHASDGSVIQIITSARDITERKKAEDEIRAASEQITASEEELRSSFDELARSDQRIRESEENYRSLVSNIPGTVYHCANDPDWTMHYMSPEIEALSGYPASDFIQNAVRSYASIIHPEDREMVDRVVQDGVEKKAIYTIEYRICRADGTIRWVFEQGHGLFSPDGDLLWLNGIFLDQTERKRAEEALARNEMQLRIITDTVPGVLYQFYARPSGEMGLYFVSGRSEELFGISGDLKTFFPRFTECVVPEDREAFLRSIDEAVKTGTRWDFRGRFIKPDGREIHFHGLSTPVRSADEQVFHGVLLDITGQEEAKQALLASEEQYRSLIETTGTGYVILDNDGRVVTANPEYLRLTGRLTLEEIQGKPVTDWTAPYDLERNEREVEQCFRTGQVRDLEIDYQKPDGTIQPVEVNASIVESGSGKIILTICRDITERRNAEKALKTEQDFTRLLLDTSPAFVVAIGSDGTTISMNRALIDALEYTPEEIRGADYLKTFVPEEDRDLLAGVFRQIIYDGKVTVNENRIVSKSGKVFLVEWHGRPVKHEDQKSDFFVGVGIDITNRKRAEQELQQSRDMFRAFIDHSYDAVFIHDPDGRVLDVNSKMLELYRVTREEALAFTIADYSGPGCNMEEAHEHWEQVLAGNDQFFPWQARRPGDGSLFNVEVYLTRVVIGEQKIILGNVRDITDRKRAEEALRQSEEKYRVIIENMGDMFYRTDNDGRLIMVSPSAARFTGYSSAEEMIGLDIRTIYPNPDDRDAFLAELKKEGSVTGYLISIKTRDGTIRAVTASSHYYRDAEGNVQGVEGILHDVTDLQEAGKAVQEANRKLNLLNSITRHDMLNQLLILKGYLELLRRKPHGDAAAGYLEKSARVTDILEHQISFTRDYQDLGIKAPVWQDIRTLVNQHMATIPAGNIRIVNDCAAVGVYADPLLEKVFFNLIDNALKYGGEILTAVRFSCHEAETGLIIVCEDDGEGIAPEDKKHLFVQGFGKNTGLGLFLSREILSITGITITETGEPGKGARFEMTVPKGRWRPLL